ncbi:hypothetical protein COV82_06030 [Candidatus Peregrinibacteria bacterium CG11_big_fil_rev_8_21_14_0_20_46_8]|nr:MAG: hypothetical protein COV82_06030 [Candidatus Peregrinibacteria bacterium CG11_big_fil_rev_8_21_14_0_20_46_8]
MRIGIDARFYSSAFTGIGCYVKELVEHLAKIDTRHEYILFMNDPYYREFEVPNKHFKKVHAGVPHYTFAEQWKFAQMLKRHNLDLMHFTHFNAPLLYRRPSVVTIHDLTLSFYPGQKMGHPIYQFAYNLVIRSIARRAKKIIAVSAYTKKDAVNLLNIHPEKIQVIHNGVGHRFHHITDQHLLETFREDYGLTKPYILYTGVWRSHKNLVNLIRAFAVLKKEHGFEGWLVISGKHDPWYPEVQNTVGKEKLEGSVRFTGHVPDNDIVLLYNAAMMYVLPSFYEGFGLPALEAFASGVPVCASETSSIPEVCGRDNAIFFNPHDVHDMAAKMAELTKSEETRKKYRERGFERVKEFSWDKMARETLEVYSEALQQ